VRGIGGERRGSLDGAAEARGRAVKGVGDSVGLGQRGPRRTRREVAAAEPPCGCRERLEGCSELASEPPGRTSSKRRHRDGDAGDRDPGGRDAAAQLVVGLRGVQQQRPGTHVGRQRHSDGETAVVGAAPGTPLPGVLHLVADERLAILRCGGDHEQVATDHREDRGPAAELRDAQLQLGAGAGGDVDAERELLERRLQAVERPILEQAANRDPEGDGEGHQRGEHEGERAGDQPAPHGGPCSNRRPTPRTVVT
jgi:hypothetical protein